LSKKMWKRRCFLFTRPDFSGNFFFAAEFKIVDREDPLRQGSLEGWNRFSLLVSDHLRSAISGWSPSHD
jgi:hypothetical protein